MNKNKSLFLVTAFSVFIAVIFIINATNQNLLVDVETNRCEGMGGGESRGLDITAGCYQTMGYEMVAKVDTKLKIDVAILAEQALKICQKIENMQHQMECATGVFNRIAESYLENRPNFIINVDDPLWLCKLQENNIKPVCYGRMARLYLFINDNDFTKAIEKAAPLTEKDYQYNVIANIAALYVSNSKIDNSKGKELCDSTPENVEANCIRGLAIGFFQSAESGEEYKEAVAFCSKFIDKNRDICYEKIVPYFHNIYPLSQLNKICGELDDKYKDLCLPGAR